MSSRKGRRKAARASGDEPRRPAHAAGARSAPVRFAALPTLTPPSALEAWAFGVLVFAALMALYAYTAPRSVVLEDDGEFIVASFFQSVPHPPGYPLFILLVKPFLWIPIGTVAYRVHLATGCFAALAGAAVWWIARTFSGRSGPALLATLALGVSAVFWSQAIIADVYSLNALLFFLALALSVAYVHRPRAALLNAIALVFTLGLSNHWPLLVLASPAIVLVLLPVRRALLDHVLARPLAVAGWFAAGLLPYGVMVYWSLHRPDLAFLGPISSLTEFLAVVSRAGYSSVENSPTAGVADKIQFLGFLGREIGAQFMWPGLAVVVIGAIVQWRRLREAASLALLVAFAGATVVLVAQLGWDYDFLKRAILRVYPVVPYGVMAIWLAIGLAWLADTLERKISLADVILIEPAGVALIALLFHANSPVNNRRDYTYGQDYAETLLASFDPNAVVFTHSDVDVNTLLYFHCVERRRPDIQLMHDQGLGLSCDGRLFPPTTLSPEEKQRRLESFARSSPRPVYFMGYAPSTLSDQEFGMYRKSNASRPGPATSSLSLEPRFVEYVRRVIAAPRPSDPWTAEHRNLVIGQMGSILSSVVDFKLPGYEKYERDLAQVSQEFTGLLRRIALLDSQQAMPDAQLLALVEQNESLFNETIGRKDWASLFVLKSHVLKRLNRPGEATAAQQRAVEIDPTTKF